MVFSGPIECDLYMRKFVDLMNKIVHNVSF